MSYEFIQVTARKENGDFALCSNLSLMDNQRMTPAQAEEELAEMAVEYQLNGYTIEWTREVMTDAEAEIWGPLFEQATALQ